MTRKAHSLSSYFHNDRENLEFVQVDVQNYTELVKALTGVDIAFYLIHSMEGSSKEWKKFAERDRVAAENFARAVTEAWSIEGYLSWGFNLWKSKNYQNICEVEQR